MFTYLRKVIPDALVQKDSAKEHRIQARKELFRFIAAKGEALSQKNYELLDESDVLYICDQYLAAYGTEDQFSNIRSSLCGLYQLFYAFSCYFSHRILQINHIKDRSLHPGHVLGLMVGHIALLRALAHMSQFSSEDSDVTMVFYKSQLIHILCKSLPIISHARHSSFLESTTNKPSLAVVKQVGLTLKRCILNTITLPKQFQGIDQLSRGDALSKLFEAVSRYASGDELGNVFPEMAKEITLALVKQTDDDRISNLLISETNSQLLFEFMRRKDSCALLDQRHLFSFTAALDYLHAGSESFSTFLLEDIESSHLFHYFRDVFLNSAPDIFASQFLMPGTQEPTPFLLQTIDSFAHLIFFGPNAVTTTSLIVPDQTSRKYNTLFCQSFLYHDKQRASISGITTPRHPCNQKLQEATTSSSDHYLVKNRELYQMLLDVFFSFDAPNAQPAKTAVQEKIFETLFLVFTLDQRNYFYLQKHNALLKLLLNLPTFSNTLKKKTASLFEFYLTSFQLLPTVELKGYLCSLISIYESKTSVLPDYSHAMDNLKTGLQFFNQLGKLDVRVLLFFKEFGGLDLVLSIFLDFKRLVKDEKTDSSQISLLKPIFHTGLNLVRRLIENRGHGIRTLDERLLNIFADCLGDTELYTASKDLLTALLSQENDALMGQVSTALARHASILETSEHDFKISLSILHLLDDLLLTNVYFKKSMRIHGLVHYLFSALNQMRQVFIADQASNMHAVKFILIAQVLHAYLYKSDVHLSHFKTHYGFDTFNTLVKNTGVILNNRFASLYHYVMLALSIESHTFIQLFYQYGFRESTLERVNLNQSNPLPETHPIYNRYVACFATASIDIEVNSESNPKFNSESTKAGYDFSGIILRHILEHLFHSEPSSDNKARLTQGEIFAMSLTALNTCSTEPIRSVDHREKQTVFKIIELLTKSKRNQVVLSQGSFQITLIDEFSLDLIDTDSPIHYPLRQLVRNLLHKNITPNAFRAWFNLIKRLLLFQDLLHSPATLLSHDASDLAHFFIDRPSKIGEAIESLMETMAKATDCTASQTQHDYLHFSYRKKGYGGLCSVLAPPDPAKGFFTNGLSFTTWFRMISTKKDLSSLSDEYLKLKSETAQLEEDALRLIQLFNDQGGLLFAFFISASNNLLHYKAADGSYYEFSNCKFHYDQWYHLGIVHSRGMLQYSKVKIYLNGSLIDDLAIPFPKFPAQSTITATNNLPLSPKSSSLASSHQQTEKKSGKITGQDTQNNLSLERSHPTAARVPHLLSSKRPVSLSSHLDLFRSVTSTGELNLLPGLIASKNTQRDTKTTSKTADIARTPPALMPQAPRIYCVIGTAKNQAHQCQYRSKWNLGGSYLYEEELSVDMLQTMYMVGPAYQGYFDGSLQEFKNYDLITHNTVKAAVKTELAKNTGPGRTFYRLYSALSGLKSTSSTAAETSSAPASNESSNASGQHQNQPPHLNQNQHQRSLIAKARYTSDYVHNVDYTSTTLFPEFSTRMPDPKSLLLSFYPTMRLSPEFIPKSLYTPSYLQKLLGSPISEEEFRIYTRRILLPGTLHLQLTSPKPCFKYEDFVDQIYTTSCSAHLIKQRGFDADLAKIETAKSERDMKSAAELSWALEQCLAWGHSEPQHSSKPLLYQCQHCSNQHLTNTISSPLLAVSQNISTSIENLSYHREERLWNEALNLRKILNEKNEIICLLQTRDNKKTHLFDPNIAFGDFLIVKRGSFSSAVGAGAGLSALLFLILSSRTIQTLNHALQLLVHALKNSTHNYIQFETINGYMVLSTILKLRHQLWTFKTIDLLMCLSGCDFHIPVEHRVISNPAAYRNLLFDIQAWRLMTEKHQAYLLEQLENLLVKSARRDFNCMQLRKHHAVQLILFMFHERVTAFANLELAFNLLFLLVSYDVKQMYLIGRFVLNFFPNLQGEKNSAHFTGRNDSYEYAERVRFLIFRHFKQLLLDGEVASPHPLTVSLSRGFFSSFLSMLGAVYLNWALCCHGARKITLSDQRATLEALDLAILLFTTHPVDQHQINQYRQYSGYYYLGYRLSPFYNVPGVYERLFVWAVKLNLHRRRRLGSNSVNAVSRANSSLVDANGSSGRQSYASSKISAESLSGYLTHLFETKEINKPSSFVIPSPIDPLLVDTDVIQPILYLLSILRAKSYLQYFSSSAPSDPEENANAVTGVDVEESKKFVEELQKSFYGHRGDLLFMSQELGLEPIKDQEITLYSSTHFGGSEAKQLAEKVLATPIHDLSATSTRKSSLSAIFDAFSSALAPLLFENSQHQQTKDENKETVFVQPNGKDEAELLIDQNLQHIQLLRKEIALERDFFTNQRFIKDLIHLIFPLGLFNCKAKLFSVSQTAVTLTNLYYSNDQPCTEHNESETTIGLMRGAMNGTKKTAGLVMRLFSSQTQDQHLNLNTGSGGAQNQASLSYDAHASCEPAFSYRDALAFNLIDRFSATCECFKDCRSSFAIFIDKFISTNPIVRRAVGLLRSAILTSWNLEPEPRILAYLDLQLMHLHPAVMLAFRRKIYFVISQFLRPGHSTKDFLLQSDQNRIWAQVFVFLQNYFAFNRIDPSAQQNIDFYASLMHNLFAMSAFCLSTLYENSYYINQANQQILQYQRLIFSEIEHFIVWLYALERGLVPGSKKISGQQLSRVYDGAVKILAHELRLLTEKPIESHRLQFLIGFVLSYLFKEVISHFNIASWTDPERQTSLPMLLSSFSQVALKQYPCELQSLLLNMQEIVPSSPIISPKKDQSVLEFFAGMAVKPTSTAASEEILDYLLQHTSYVYQVSAYLHNATNEYINAHHHQSTTGNNSNLRRKNSLNNNNNNNESQNTCVEGPIVSKPASLLLTRRLRSHLNFYLVLQLETMNESLAMATQNALRKNVVQRLQHNDKLRMDKYKLSYQESETYHLTQLTKLMGHDIIQSHTNSKYNQHNTGLSKKIKHLACPDPHLSLDDVWWCQDSVEGPHRVKRRMARDLKFVKKYYWNHDALLDNETLSSLLSVGGDRATPFLLPEIHALIQSYKEDPFTTYFDQCMKDLLLHRTDNSASLAISTNEEDTQNLNPTARNDKLQLASPASIVSDSFNSGKPIETVNKTTTSFSLPSSLAKPQAESTPAKFTAQAAKQSSSLRSAEPESESSDLERSFVLRQLRPKDKVIHEFNVLKIRGLEMIPCVLILCQKSLYLIEHYCIVFSTNHDSTTASLRAGSHYMHADLARAKDCMDYVLPELQLMHPTRSASVYGSSSANKGFDDGISTPTMTSTDGVMTNHKTRVLMSKYTAINNIRKRKYLFSEIAIEIYFDSGENEFLVFHKGDREGIYELLASRSEESLKAASKQKELDLKRQQDLRGANNPLFLKAHRFNTTSLPSDILQTLQTYTEQDWAMLASPSPTRINRRTSVHNPATPTGSDESDAEGQEEKQDLRTVDNNGSEIPVLKRKFTTDIALANQRSIDLLAENSTIENQVPAPSATQNGNLLYTTLSNSATSSSLSQPALLSNISKGLQRPSSLLGTGGVMSRLFGWQSTISRATQYWMDRRISNFQYLIWVNFEAGRTFNDISQYPVFPWILKDYDSDEIDRYTLMDPEQWYVDNAPNCELYRDLTKPMGNQTLKRSKIFQERFENWEPDPSLDLFSGMCSSGGDCYDMCNCEHPYDISSAAASVAAPPTNPLGQAKNAILARSRRTNFISNALFGGSRSNNNHRIDSVNNNNNNNNNNNSTGSPHGAQAFHYGTHYSSAMIVASYLIRLEPFTSMFLHIQGGKFDHPDRMFSSIKEAWVSASETNTADVKEVVPEFYFNSDFLKNKNGFNFGKTQLGVQISDVGLPVWAKGDPREFVRLNRIALESEYVSNNLHHWIDLIFGYKQRGEAAVESLNCFQYLSYEGSVNLDQIKDPVQRMAAIGIINNFGQTPRQIFNEPHLARKPISGLSVKKRRNLFSPIEPVFFSNYSSLLLYAVSNSSSSGSSKAMSARISALVKLVFLSGYPFNHPRYRQDTISAMATRIFLHPANQQIYYSSINTRFIPSLYNYIAKWDTMDNVLRIVDHKDKLIGSMEKMHAGGLHDCSFADAKVLITVGEDTVVRVWKFSDQISSVSGQHQSQNLMMNTTAAAAGAGSEMNRSISLGTPRSNYTISSSFSTGSGVSSLDGGQNTTSTAAIAAGSSNPTNGSAVRPTGIPGIPGKANTNTGNKSSSQQQQQQQQQMSSSQSIAGARSKQTFKILKDLYAHESPVHVVESSKAHGIFVTGAEDGSCILWDLNRIRLVRRLKKHRAPISKIVIDEATGNLYTAAGTELNIWTVNGELIVSYCTSHCEAKYITSLYVMDTEEWDAENRLIFTGHNRGEIKMWVLRLTDNSNLEMEADNMGSQIYPTEPNESNYIYTLELVGLIHLGLVQQEMNRSLGIYSHDELTKNKNQGQDEEASLILATYQMSKIYPTALYGLFDSEEAVVRLYCSDARGIRYSWLIHGVDSDYYQGLLGSGMANRVLRVRGKDCCANCACGFDLAVRRLYCVQCSLGCCENCLTETVPSHMQSLSLFSAALQHLCTRCLSVS